MNVSSTIDMVSSSASASTASNQTSSSDTENDFESMLSQQVSGNDNSQESAGATEQGVATEGEGNTVTDVEETPEITDLQRELMAALYMQGAPVVVETVETVEQVALMTEEVVVATEEVQLLDNGALDLGNGEVSSQLGNQTREETPEEVVLTTETEEVFVLDEVEVVEEATVETEMSEEVVETETMDVEADVEIETETEAETVVEETVVQDAEDVPDEQNDGGRQESNSQQSTADGDEAQTVAEPVEQETKVFGKMEAMPVKVGEVVNMEEPDVDQQMSKIIAQANENGEKVVTIQLTPENLGTVTIQLTQSADGVLQILMQAVDSDAAKLLGSHAESIAQALQTAGSTVTVEVSTITTENAEQSMQDFDQEGQHQEQEEQEHDEEEQLVVTDDFMQQLRLGLVQFSMDNN